MTEHENEAMKEWIKSLTDLGIIFHLFVAKTQDVPLSWGGHETEYLITKEVQGWNNWIAWLFTFGATPDILTRKKG